MREGRPGRPAACPPRRRSSWPGEAAGTWLVAALLIASGLKVELVGMVFVEGVPFAHRARLATAIGLWAGAAATLLALPRRTRLPLALGLALAAGATALTDLLVWRHYDDLPSVAAGDDLANVPWILPSAAAHLRPTDLWLFADVGLVLVVALVLAWAARGRGAGVARRSDGGRRWAWVSCLALVAAVAAHGPAQVMLRDPEDVFEYAFQRREVVAVLGLAGYHAWDAGRYFATAVHQAAGRSERETGRLAETLARIPPTRSPLFGAAQGRNVVLINVESLQRWTVGLAVDGQAVTPVLTALAGESLAFERVLDQTHRSSTADAEWLVLNSLYPLAAGATATRFPGNTWRSLATVLAERGYTTLSAAAQPPAFWNMRHAHPRQGFARSWFRRDFPPGPWLGVGLADDLFLAEMGRRLAGIREPFLAYLLTSTSHHPYALPPEARGLRLPALTGTEIGDYLQTVHYTDRALGLFVEALRRSGLLDRTLLVVYGDHTAWLEDTPALRDVVAVSPGAPSPGVASEFTRWWTQASLPLLIRLPGGRAAGPRERAGGLVDVTPTVLALLGIDDPAGPRLGRDLTDDLEPPLVASRAGMATDGQRVAFPGAAGCYDLWTGRPAG